MQFASWAQGVLIALLLARNPHAAVFRAKLEKDWNKLKPLVSNDLEILREEAWQMFDNGFNNYMTVAFPQDDLRPLSCKGTNSNGGIGVTLLDALDTLIVMNRSKDIEMAIKSIRKYVNFDVDARVSLFEINIRVMGGLLSSHILIERNPELGKGYNGEFLRFAIDMADRLLPAFNTTSGIPIAWINLQKGILPRESREACVAGAGTLILEFGTLSHLTGDWVYGDVAKAAMQALYDSRSNLGLFGNTIDSQSTEWMRTDGGIGAGIDSFFEYLLKAYLLFGDQDYLNMFSEAYSAAMFHMLMPGNVNGYQWIFDADIELGHLTRPWISSLSSFWPGMQALMGQEEHASNLHSNFTSVFFNFGGLPELFSLDGKTSHPHQTAYPLRPELIESTYILHELTGNPRLLEVGQCLHSVIKATNTNQCGHAHIKDVVTGELEDGMESFFLSETTKYLYLLFSNTTSLLDNFVFTTEAHLLPPVSRDVWELSQDNDLKDRAPARCKQLCEPQTVDEMAMAKADIAVKFPLLKIKDGDSALIRKRRCNACVAVTEKIENLPRRNPAEHYDKMTSYAVNTVDGQVRCVWELRGGEPYCFKVKPEQYPGEVKYKIIVDGATEDGLTEISIKEAYLLVDNEDHYVEAPVTMAAFGPTLPNASKEYQCPAIDEEESFIHAEVRERYDTPTQGADDPRTCSLYEPSIVQSQKYSSPILQGKLVHAVPEDACHSLDNSSDVFGAIAVVKRGSCSFSQKVMAAEKAGAVGVIVINNKGPDATVVMGMSSDMPVPSIASGMISNACGQKLQDKPVHGWNPTCILAPSKQEAISLSQLLDERFQKFFSVESHEVDGRGDMRVFGCSL